jgi:TfoX/Sxy family transcriptional regulator of competence genes
MFGEYALYVNEKVVALICDNQLFVKPTVEGKVFIGEVEEAPPYPGAKNYYLITDQLDDEAWMTKLMQITASVLHLPKMKKRKNEH